MPRAHCLGVSIGCLWRPCRSHKTDSTNQMTSFGHAAVRLAKLSSVPVVALLFGCSLLPNTDGIAIDHPRGLDGISKSLGIAELDPTTGVPLIEQTFQRLKKSDPQHRLLGTTYDLSTGSNMLGTRWLI